MKAFGILSQLHRVGSDDPESRAMKDALRNAGKQAALGVFGAGERAVMEESFLSGAQQFVCRMYGCKVPSVNQARCDLWHKGRANPAELPPTEHCFALHLLRVCFQMELWERAVTFSSDPGEYEAMQHTPQQFGWDDKCQPIWTERDAAPLALLQSVHCKTCKSGCTKRRCTCQQNGLKCTRLCGCQNCQNRDTESSGMDEDVREEAAARALMAEEDDAVDDGTDDAGDDDCGGEGGTDSDVEMDGLHCEAVMDEGSEDEGEGYEGDEEDRMSEEDDMDEADE
ncbi:MAG: hypothetical protein CME32_09240 [Gimesia sp.]|nr:hypothetical protein [Gimesia sp.]